jgi:hypothetical protein
VRRAANRLKHKGLGLLGETECQEHLRKGISCAKHLHVCEERRHDLLNPDMPCLAEGAESFNAPREANLEGRQRIEGEDVGDTSRAGTLFGPTPRAASRRGGGKLVRIGIAPFSLSGAGNFVKATTSILSVPLPRLSR